MLVDLIVLLGAVYPPPRLKAFQCFEVGGLMPVEA
jgi:hypothetical protein